jgi:hypothetical protein
MTTAHGVVLGPFHFTVIRVILLVGFLRAMLRGERLNERLNGLDRLTLLWAGWLLTSSLLHTDASSALVFRLGLVYDVCGIYFLVRVFCRSIEDLVLLCKMIAIVLVPVAVEMLHEKLTAYNMFSILGGVDALPYIRQGNIRAQGPFSHAILAGTVGAVCLPMTVLLWKLDRKVALIGTGACVAMVFASTSSGPILSTLAAMFALFMWKFRERRRSFVWLGILAYIAMDIVMKDPAYYIVARIDLAGGSTGWYRARLIESSIEHFFEWWIVGTDYTRHWMVTGLERFPNQTDITNHYIKFGVLGGLPLLFLFIAQIVKGFSYVGSTIRHWCELSVQAEYIFVVWALGAALFAHVVTAISISYFDQSGIFLYITLAAISATQSARFGVDKYEDVRVRKRGIGWMNQPEARGREKAILFMHTREDRG